ncbi:beta-ketoacyl-[acyl-carrier-protein] synthase family protein [Lignipirellula cremea]|uniref:3-oxoacyl-[acyl-carrier-protein] synthase 2 n=1 Tax=Lignipirellula cremea TaxID=2528010 RepID=A0A518DW40_9BACT|nr:beta-ketoacyl-[acyl-carrier-protein] synthase family protein [Lignipirellula cremea]QDU96055.1 3-oxoacyl-[acyl-carrier-protein] synthase 2 [Lignipirellula cremea]
MVQKREVVVTGVGMVSPIGIGKQAFWQSLAEGRSGIVRRGMFPGRDWAFDIGGLIQDFDGKQYVKPRKAIKVMCRPIQFGYSSAFLAMEDAGIEKGGVDPDRLGVVFGGELYYCELEEFEDTYRHCLEDGEFHFDRWAKSAMRDLYPLWMLKHLPNMTACHVGIAFDARGPCNTITLSEVSGSLALIECSAIIERGRADVMIAGGSGERTNPTPMVYRGMANLSHRIYDPTGACRPFDANRDGMVIGEGAASIVLESRDHALNRGANILAQVKGFARTQQTGGEPAGGAIRRSIALALEDAGLKASDIGYVNAHGLSTVNEDLVEAQAIHDVLGDTPVTAPKSFFGNLGAGGGAVEMAVSLLGLAHGVAPFTLNYETPDPACPVKVIAGELKKNPQGAVIALNQTYTGQATAVILTAT